MKNELVGPSDRTSIVNPSNDNHISFNGQIFPLDETNGWVTISRYIEIYNVPNVSIVLNWISRGVVPKENVVTIPYLNKLKIIKSMPYEPRGYRQRKSMK